VQYLTFRVARQDFIMDASRVRAMVPAYEVTPLETQVPWIVGVASIRGQDFPVIDLRGKLNIAHGSRGRLPVVIVVQVASSNGPRLLGFIADRVSEVLTLRPRELQRGAVRISGRPRRMLDPDAILSEEELLGYWRLAGNPVTP
jgi:chemotaxis signal transduction protein